MSAGSPTRRSPSRLLAGKRADIWAQMITFTEVASLAVAVALIITAFKLRAPGMSLNRMPMFVWAQVVTSFMVLFAMPAVMLASTALILDRLVGTHFFNVEQAAMRCCGSTCSGSSVTPRSTSSSSRRPASSRRSSRRSRGGRFSATWRVVLSLVSTAFIGFGLWVHHMFATGLPQLGESFFTAASIMIAIPTGMQFFCWIATMWPGGSSVKTPMLWVLGFFAIFVVRRADGRDARRRPARPAGPRYVLRRRASSLRADRRRRVPAVRRLLLLVPEDHRTHAERAAREVAVLAASSSAST